MKIEMTGHLIVGEVVSLLHLAATIAGYPVLLSEG